MQWKMSGTVFCGKSWKLIKKINKYKNPSSFISLEPGIKINHVPVP